MTMRCEIRKFTLVEMVAVIAIAGIMFALLAPAFSHMSKGDKVQQTASNLKLGIAQAQTKAIVSRKYVALVLPSEKDTKTKNSNYCLSGYRLAYVKRDGDNFSFNKYVPESKWRNPRDGAALLTITSTEPKRPKNNPPQVRDKFGDKGGIISKEDGKEILKPIRETPEKNKQYKAIIFSPNGGIISDTALYLKISQIVDLGDQIRFFDDNSIIIKINVLTGKAEMKEYEDAAS